MSGHILIIDSVATHRIVLKAKLASAQYDVVTCASCRDAENHLSEKRVDLVMINLSDPTEDRHAYCRALREKFRGDSIAIMGISVLETSRARFAALNAGVDDVLPNDVSDSLMQARVRSLLRRRTVGFEWQLRDATSKALGFEEDQEDFVSQANIAILSDNDINAAHIAELVSNKAVYRTQISTPDEGIAAGQKGAMVDLFMIDGRIKGRKGYGLFELISSIHARQENAPAAQIVILPNGQYNRAAMLLDLGADDVVFADIGAKELSIRIRTLLAHRNQQKRLRERVRTGLRAAVTDQLTGLYNRRYADTHLKRIAQTACDAGREYAVMVLDIDHFKVINDTYGHSAGDQVLRELADRLRCNFRAVDLIARIGGEEFLVALPETTASQAHVAAERLRTMINQAPFRVGEGIPPIKVTISVGLAVDVHDGLKKPDTDHLFDRADKALYHSKNSGRDRVSVAVNAA